MTEVRVETPVYGGYAMARQDGVVFIKGALPGELVEVSFKEKKKDYRTAEVVEVIEPSPFRVQPACGYFGECGGCQLQYISYEKQLSIKEEVLRDCLRRIGAIETPLEETISNSPFNYRKRGQFKISPDGRIGLYREGTREVVALNGCPLMTEEINKALRSLNSLELSGIKEIHITSSDTLMALLYGKGFDEAISSKFIENGFSAVAFEDGSYTGSGYVGFKLLDLVYTVSPWSFLQSNWPLNNKVVELIVNTLGSTEDGRALDMYAGAGNFSLPLATNFKEVVAVEENASAVKDGLRNAALNKITNFRYAKGNAEKAKLDGSFNVLILDPPRPGLTKEVIGRVSALEPERIVYVSCNPATFARDLKRLKDAYNMESLRMIDFFPNTYHIESVAFLRRK